ncbi:hypothetical protein ACQV2B_03060 [Pantoea allii]|uniref:hypothetical protein n=1 Tax=Pantoea allii TaxID=574096 RepID=UPI003D321FCC
MMISSKSLLSVLMAFLVSSCAMTPEEFKKYQVNHEFDKTVYKAKSGENLSVAVLKRRYEAETGTKLPEPDVGICEDNNQCYYNLYANKYDDLINKYRDNKREQERQQKEDKCNGEPSCKKEKNIAILKGKIREQYNFMLTMYPYSQSDADVIFRNVCRASEVAYKRGFSKVKFLQSLQDTPGMSPQIRIQLSEIASTCWDITSEGVDWNAPLRQN